MQWQIMHTRNEENLAIVDELVLGQEDHPQIHHSTRPIAQSAIVWIVFFTATLA